MPQLDTSTFSSQLFWLGMCFLILYFILSYIAVPKITGVLESRQHILEEKINQASVYREQAEDLLADYEKTLSQAREEAHQRYQSALQITSTEIAHKKKELLSKLEERLHRAEQELYRARLDASTDMHSIAQEIAREILQKITGHTYSKDEWIEKRGDT